MADHEEREDEETSRPLHQVREEIGNAQAFPVPHQPIQTPGWRPGMTYREWLIGMVLSHHNVALATASTERMRLKARGAIKLADLVIDELARED